MRTDGNFNDKVREWEKSQSKTFVNLFRPNGVSDVSVGFSANERNHLFLSRTGQHFFDVSGISGLDTPSDSRAFAIWDYNRDGWQDVAVINANEPMLQVYRNDIGRGFDQTSNGKTAPATSSDSSGARRPGQFVAFRFVGGNHKAEASTDSSPRDGYGALVTLNLDGTPVVREHRCGEGLAAQNSSTMLIGIGDRSTVENVSVRWPSGNESATSDIPSGSLITVYENPANSPTGDAFVLSPYAIETNRATAAGKPVRPTFGEYTPSASAIKANSTRFRMYTTMATWCTACKREIPQIKVLRSAFAETIDLFGVPVDAEDDPARLRGYVDTLHPPYTLLEDISTKDIEAIKALLISVLKSEALPGTVITNPHGKVIYVDAGVPSVSEVTRLILEG